jgi:hypothetical protein
VPKELLVFRALLVQVHKEYRETLDKMVRREYKDYKESKEHREDKEYKAKLVLVLREFKGFKVLPGCKVLQAKMVLKEYKAYKDFKVRVVHRAFKDHWVSVHKVFRVVRASKGKLEFRVLLEREVRAHRESKDRKEFKETMVL